jgi:hypothetical protein
MSSTPRPLPLVPDDLPLVQLQRGFQMINPSSILIAVNTGSLDFRIVATEVQENLRAKLNNQTLSLSVSPTGLTISGINPSDRSVLNSIREVLYGLYNIKLPMNETIDRTAILKAHNDESKRVSEEIQRRVAAATAAPAQASGMPTLSPTGGVQTPTNAPTSQPNAGPNRVSLSAQLDQFFSTISVPEDLNDPEKLVACLGLDRANLSFIKTLPDGELLASKILEEKLTKVLSDFASLSGTSINMQQASFIRALVAKVKDPDTVKKI